MLKMSKRNKWACLAVVLALGFLGVIVTIPWLHHLWTPAVAGIVVCALVLGSIASLVMAFLSDA